MTGPIPGRSCSSIAHRCSRRPVGDAPVAASLCEAFDVIQINTRGSAHRAAATVAATAFTARSLGFPLLYLARPPQCPTGFCSGMLAILDDLHTVHEHMFYTGRVLMWFFEGGVICDRRWIEHHHVGKHSFLQKSASIEPQICRRQATQSMNRVTH